NTCASGCILFLLDVHASNIVEAPHFGNAKDYNMLQINDVLVQTSKVYGKQEYEDLARIAKEKGMSIDEVVKKIGL
ncbi:MAG: hypothetical protein J6X49_09775, partial [Victivallales bacterium]|nr:hypothetical protein [Victivallales bacterium]